MKYKWGMNHLKSELRLQSFWSMFIYAYKQVEINLNCDVQSRIVRAPREERVVIQMTNTATT